MPLAPALIVLEPRPRWESQLKRRPGGERALVRPCRSAAELFVHARRAPGSVAVLDLLIGERVVLECLDRFGAERLDIAPVVVAPDEWRPLEWRLRELGAVGFVHEGECGALAALCARLLHTAAAGRRDGELKVPSSRV